MFFPLSGQKYWSGNSGLNTGLDSGQNTGVGSLSLLQGIFTTQGCNPGLLRCRQILYQLSHKGSPFHFHLLVCPFMYVIPVVVVHCSLVAQLVKNPGDLRSIPGFGRSPGEGKGYQLQYSGLENSIDCIVHGITKSWTRLSDFRFHFSLSLSLDIMFFPDFVLSTFQFSRILLMYPC